MPQIKLNKILTKKFPKKSWLICTKPSIPFFLSALSSALQSIYQSNT